MGGLVEIPVGSAEEQADSTFQSSQPIRAMLEPGETIDRCGNATATTLGSIIQLHWITEWLKRHLRTDRASETLRDVGSR